MQMQVIKKECLLSYNKTRSFVDFLNVLCMHVMKWRGFESVLQIAYKYNKYAYNILGTGGVQGQVKGQRLMGIKAVNDSIGLATYQSKIYEK